MTETRLQELRTLVDAIESNGGNKVLLTLEEVRSLLAAHTALSKIDRMLDSYQRGDPAPTYADLRYLCNDGVRPC